ncbi:MAG TPA: class F sortase [Micromonosporaceae bacterium]
MTRHGWAVPAAALAAGTATLVLALWPGPPAGTLEEDPAGQATTATPTGAPPTPTRIPVRPGDLPSAATKVAPVRLRIPAAHTDAPVNPVGVNQHTGELQVPPSVDEVGWYRHGPGLDATAGSIVIAGHLDGAGQGPGAFFRLGELRPGDRITVTGTDGRSRTYRVTSREAHPKTDIPLDRYFARDGKPRLTLITCSGPFDRETRNYRDNLVVTAVPA